ncbi:hypothetical protein ACOSQ4_031617 [Xanthoceras sorbifolium]
METLGRLVYHCRADPMRLEPKPLYIHASLRSRMMVAVNIYKVSYDCAMWSSGSVVQSYCFIPGKLNFLGIFTNAIASTKGESAKLLAALFFIGVGIPRMRWMSASISANLRAKSRLANVGSIFTRSGFDNAECEGPDGVPCSRMVGWVKPRLPLGVEIGGTSCVSLATSSDRCLPVLFDVLSVICRATMCGPSAARMLGSEPTWIGSRSLAVVPCSSGRTGS